MNKPKIQGTKWESRLVEVLGDTFGAFGAERIAEGGSKDLGDVRFTDVETSTWYVEAKATQTLNVTRVLGQAQKKSGVPLRTVLAWKRLTKKDGNKRRTPDGVGEVVVMSLDTFRYLIELSS